MSTNSNNDPTQLTIDNAAYEATAGTMQDGMSKKLNIPKEIKS